MTNLVEVKYPYPPAEYYEPSRGKQFVGLRLKQCLSKDYLAADFDGEDFYSTYNGEWFIGTPSGNQYTADSSWDDFPSPKFPEGVAMNPGDCLKGWVLVEVPEATKIKKFIWRPGDVTTAEWLP